MTPIAASWILLGVFLASWVAAASWAGKAAGSMPVKVLAPLYTGGAAFLLVLLGLNLFVPAVSRRIWPPDVALDWSLVFTSGAGWAVCWWSRWHLGRLWAGGVLVREGHHVVDTGPYAIVRHPIYSGAFLGVLAMAMLKARPFDFLFTLGFILFFAAKARVEERFLVQQLGRDYEDYRLRVPMLVPGLRPRTSPGQDRAR